MKNLFSLVDLTNLNPEAKTAEIDTLVETALKYGVAGVCVHPSLVKYVADKLVDSKVAVVTVVGFPLGMNTTEVKAFEAKEALKNGANEIDMVVNHYQIKNQLWEDVKKDISRLASTCHNHGALLKVIIETSRCTEYEIKKLSDICLEAKADFIKTSTGFTSSGAKLEHVELITKHTNGALAIKASGGIRDQEFFAKLAEAGASRIGTSSINYLVDEKAKSDSNY